MKNSPGCPGATGTGNRQGSASYCCPLSGPPAAPRRGTPDGGTSSQTALLASLQAEMSWLFLSSISDGCQAPSFQAAVVSLFVFFPTLTVYMAKKGAWFGRSVKKTDQLHQLPRHGFPFQLLSLFFMWQSSTFSVLHFTSGSLRLGACDSSEQEQPLVTCSLDGGP